jgi:hypothetical protein
MLEAGMSALWLAEPAELAELFALLIQLLARLEASWVKAVMLLMSCPRLALSSSVKAEPPPEPVEPALGMRLEVSEEVRPPPRERPAMGLRVMNASKGEKVRRLMPLSRARIGLASPLRFFALTSGSEPPMIAGF